MTIDTSFLRYFGVGFKKNAGSGAAYIGYIFGLGLDIL